MGDVADYLLSVDCDEDLLYDSQTSADDFEGKPSVSSTWHREIFHSAMVVRSSIMDITDKLPWPPLVLQMSLVHR